MSRPNRAALIAAAGLAFAWRLPGLFHNSFFADEALFATWARLIFAMWDPLLLQQTVDKPPLLFYLQAIFFSLIGTVEWAARLPGLAVSVLLVPLVGIWAWRLYRCRQTAVYAALLLAFLPLAIQFSATAFLDPLLTFLLTAALVATAPSDTEGDPPMVRAAGFMFGLALATKYQAVLFLPLLLGLGWWAGWKPAAWRRWLGGFLPVLAVLLLWDVIRTGGFSLWTAQMQNYGGLRLIWSWEVWPRARTWLDLGYWVWANWWLFALFALGLLWWLVRFWRGQTAVPDGLLLLFLIAYLVLHWLLAVPIWDRYLLPLLPLVAVMAGRMIKQLTGSGDWRMLLWKGGVIVVLLFPGALGAANGRFPVGGQPGADQGAADVAAYLADAPYGTVLYDHWWSWQWRYHLFDTGVYVSWVPHPAALAADLQVFGRDESRRYLALPATSAARPFQMAVSAAGFRLVPVAAAGSITLYLIEVRPPQ